MVFTIVFSLLGWLALEIAGARLSRFPPSYRDGWRKRLPLWGAAWGTYFLAFSAFAPKASASMSRCLLPTLFLVLNWSEPLVERVRYSDSTESEARLGLERLPYSRFLFDPLQPVWRQRTVS